MLWIENDTGTPRSPDKGPHFLRLTHHEFSAFIVSPLVISSPPLTRATRPRPFVRCIARLFKHSLLPVFQQYRIPPPSETPFRPKIIPPLFLTTLGLHMRNVFLSEIHISYDRDLSGLVLVVFLVRGTKLLVIKY